VLKAHQSPILQEIKEPCLTKHGVTLYLKREDLIHPTVSGNKWRKLKYNLIEATNGDHSKILTFGGAYSNHIYATAAAAKEAGLASIGIIRGEETLPLNDTLQFAYDQGMQLHYVSRSDYRLKEEDSFLNKLKDQFGECYLIPEGGSNTLAVKGCAEITEDIDLSYDLICSAVGTGGTLAGLIASHDSSVSVLGFSALKGEHFLEQEVLRLLKGYSANPQWEIVTEYHFGGYAKIKLGLIEFINSFYQKHQIVLDPIYTGKMMYGLYDLIRKGKIARGTSIVALHTGGLQGIKGIAERYGVSLPK